jgi:hypothetical protein
MTVNFLFALQREIHAYLPADATGVRSQVRAYPFFLPSWVPFPEIRLTPPLSGRRADEAVQLKLISTRSAF